MRNTLRETYERCFCSAFWCTHNQINTLMCLCIDHRTNKWSFCFGAAFADEFPDGLPMEICSKPTECVVRWLAGRKETTYMEWNGMDERNVNLLMRVTNGNRIASETDDDRWWQRSKDTQDICLHLSIFQYNRSYLMNSINPSISVFHIIYGANWFGQCDTCSTADGSLFSVRGKCDIDRFRLRFHAFSFFSFRFNTRQHLLTTANSL